MQLESANKFRYRGWRESKQFGQTAKAFSCDAYVIETTNNRVENTRETVKSTLTTLTQTRVSQIQHLRAQIKFKSVRLF